MLQNLHVKNLALIDETEVEFGPGLNILTGRPARESQFCSDPYSLLWEAATARIFFAAGLRAVW